MAAKKIKPQFRRGVNRLQVGCPAAGAFLTRLMDGSPRDFGLGTDVNAHLYYKDRYFVLRMELGVDSLLLIPAREGIERWTDTTDESRRLFDGPLFRLVALMRGFQDGWADTEGGGVLLRVATPSDFFERLLGLVRGLL